MRIEFAIYPPETNRKILDCPGVPSLNLLPGDICSGSMTPEGHEAITICHILEHRLSTELCEIGNIVASHRISISIMMPLNRIMCFQNTARQSP
jgi:hypothetical protein